MLAPTHPAVRKNGVCRGTLWRTKDASSSSTTEDFCLLIECRMQSFESLACHQRGDCPTFAVHIVGASTWTKHDNRTIRIVTHVGTHVYYQAPSTNCRDIWLAHILAGLQNGVWNRTIQTPPQPQSITPSKLLFRASIQHCYACGIRLETFNMTTPLWQYGREEASPVCRNCGLGQGLLDYMGGQELLWIQAKTEQQALAKARQLCQEAVGVVLSSQSVTSSSWTRVGESLDDSTVTTSSTPSPPEPGSPNAELSGSWQAVVEDQQQHWVHLPPTEESTRKLLECLQAPEFEDSCRQSHKLQQLKTGLLEGHLTVAEFMVQLDETNRIVVPNSIVDLKRQALHCANDMATALQFLDDESTPTCLLQSVLDFFLETVEHDLPSLAFYWQQICHIHLCMLPATDTASLERIHLMQDFLYTVSVFSITLALEVVWFHVADLEASLTDDGPARSKQRRPAVMAFLIELESIIFEHAEPWGNGGAVTIQPYWTPVQTNLLDHHFTKVHVLRPAPLAKSLRRRTKPDDEEDPSVAVQQKLDVAKRCEYFSTHLEFTRRLGSMADKLFSIEHGQRQAHLAQDLSLLNSSGSMGGDPLNRVQTSGCTRVVRVPSGEGHVFRSKERTPVLLLMEVVTEDEQESSQADEEDTEIAKKRAQSEESCPSEGASILDGEDASIGSRTPRSTALKRFGAASENSERSTQTPKKDVEKIVSDVMVQKKLTQLGIPDLSDASENDLKIVECKPAETVEEDCKNESEILENDNAKEADEQVVQDDRSVEEGEANATAEVVPSAPPTGNIQQNPSSSVSPSPKSEPSAPKRTRSRSSAFGSAADAGTATRTVDTRREVLNAIMMKGIKGDSIAAGTAHSVQRSLQDLERKQATELLFDGADEASSVSSENRVDASYVNLGSTTEKLASLGLGNASPNGIEKEMTLNDEPNEEDEVMESIRLLLIQNRVAQGHLSREDAAKVLQHASLVRNNADRSPEKDSGVIPDVSDTPTIDAGDVDTRLVGCGPLPPAVLQALTLWKGDMVSNGELLELVKRDMEFIRHSVLFDAENVDKLNENSDFWGRFAFGERWAEKKSRIAAASPQGATEGWDLVGVIVKANDDLRQEAFVMQLIQLCKEAFELAGLELWVSPYKILATGKSTGIIEMVRNAMSFDALKKRPGYGKGGLREHLQRMTEFTANPGDAFKSAQENFVRSLAAYSLMSYFFMFKDRHNGNLLLDTVGHVIHIDFGFVFGTAPGGSFSLEMSTPFKLTDEMLEVMGGLRSPLFSEFVTLFCCGFMALQSHFDTFVTIVAIMCKESSLPCFDGCDTSDVVAKLRERFCPELSKEETVAFALDLIKQATSSYGTRNYDLFQYMSQGIAA